MPPTSRQGDFAFMLLNVHGGKMAYYSIRDDQGDDSIIHFICHYA